MTDVPDADDEAVPETAVDGADIDREVGDEPTACAYTDYREGEAVTDLPATGADAEGLAAEVWQALSGVEDPEMPVSIVDLGLIYGVDCAEGDEGAHVTVEMTLTYTGCPARSMLLNDVEAAVQGVDGVASAAVRLVWTPEWTIEMVTAAGKADLREFGVSI